MHMTSGIIPDYLLLCYGMLALVGFGLALWRMNWRMLHDLEQGLILGVSFIVLCWLYTLSAGVKPGMQVHFLGVMVTVMMFGPWLGILMLTAVHLMLTFAFHIGAPAALGYNLVWCVLLPVVVAGATHTFSYYRLPRTFPIYIIQVGVGDMLCMWATALALTIHLRLYTSYTPEYLFNDFALLLILMGTMEAMISTMITSLLVSFVPQALVTFSDEEYLHGK